MKRSSSNFLPPSCACCTPAIAPLYRASHGASRRNVLSGAALGLVAAATPRVITAAEAASNPRARADAIFVGATIRTMNAAAPRAEALAVKDGRIAAVGSNAAVMALKGPGTEVIQARGRTILPGFVDPHVHIVTSAALSAFVDVRPFICPSIVDVMAKLSAAVASAAPDSWILAKGFDPTITRGNTAVTRRELDAIAPANPLFMLNASGHLAYVNSRAIELARVTSETPDPGAGGKYLKDADGHLTGVLAGAASYAPFLRIAPRADPQALIAAAHRVMQNAAAKGCTMMIDCGLGALAGIDELAILRAVTANRAAPVRMAAFMTSALMDKWLAVDGMMPGAGDDRFRLLGFKFWSDGSNQGNTGYQRKRYLNVDGRGVLSLPPEQLLAGVRRAHDLGYQVAVHANGDAAIDLVVDTFDKVLAASPRKDHRHRIEHCSIAYDDHFARMARMGVTPSFLIGHVHYWGRALRDRILGPERAARLDATASAIKAGVRFSLHSDFEVTEIGPLRCIENAVTRVMADGGEVLAPEQRIGVVAALKAMTIDAAYQGFMDHAVGSLEVGKYADLVMLEEDPLAVDASRLSAIKVAEAWVEGNRQFG